MANSNVHIIYFHCNVMLCTIIEATVKLNINEERGRGLNESKRDRAKKNRSKKE